MKQEATVVTIRIPKDLLRRIDRIVDCGKFYDTRTSILNDFILEKVEEYEKNHLKGR